MTVIGSESPNKSVFINTQQPSDYTMLTVACLHDGRPDEGSNEDLSLFLESERFHCSIIGSACLTPITRLSM